MDFDRAQLPKKDMKVSGLRSSRPVSPDISTADAGTSTPPWPTCNLKRHLSGAAATAAVNKKRKLEQAVAAAAAAAAATNNNNSPVTPSPTTTGAIATSNSSATTTNTTATMVTYCVLSACVFKYSNRTVR